MHARATHQKRLCILLSICCFVLAIGNSSIAAQTLTDGVLTIHRTAGDDRVILTQSAGNLIVEVRDNFLFSQSQFTSFAAADVNRIDVFVFGGDDKIDARNIAIDVQAYGGPGDDEFFGGDGNDFFEAGAGDDFASGSDGDDSLHGGSGQDELIGGNGDDVLSGGTGDDRVIAGGGDDTIDGDGGDDDLEGGAGRDTINGGDGDDYIEGGPDRDFLNGGPGNDLLVRFNGELEPSDGGPGIDSVRGSFDETGIANTRFFGLLAHGGPLNDDIAATIESGQVVVRVVNAGGSQQRTFNADEVDSITLYGLEGDDILSNFTDVPATLYGGDGDDVVANSGTASTFLLGEAGDDHYITNTDNDWCSDREGGNDVYVLNGGTVQHVVVADPNFHSIMVFGSDRDESVSLASFSPNPLSSTSHIDLGPGDDIFEGGRNEAVAVTVRGGNGNDILLGGYANNNERLHGDAGDDLISGEDGEDNIFGGAGDDVMYAEAHFSGSFNSEFELSSLLGFFFSGARSFMDGGPGDDTLHGGNGDDTLFGGSGDDTLFGYDGEDVLRGHGGADLLEGGRDNDIMFGGPGDDRIVGLHGEDVLRGEGGNDVLDGGVNDDLLFGGPGSDVLNGGSANDRLNGEGGVDTLNGGPGTNVLIQ